MKGSEFICLDNGHCSGPLKVQLWQHNNEVYSFFGEIKLEVSLEGIFTM